jgi:hypothetical protein
MEGYMLLVDVRPQARQHLQKHGQRLMGLNWTTTTLPFKDRENPTLGVMNNKLFVIGGVETVGAKSDTWSTTDGINWIQMNYFLTNISNGKILRFDDDDYFVGGTQWNSAGTGGSSTKAIRRYNVVSDSWDLVSNYISISFKRTYRDRCSCCKWKDLG